MFHLGQKNNIRKLSTLVCGSQFDRFFCSDSQLSYIQNSESPSKKKIAEENFQANFFIILWNFANFVKKNLIYSLKVFRVVSLIVNHRMTQDTRKLLNLGKSQNRVTTKSSAPSPFHKLMFDPSVQKQCKDRYKICLALSSFS